MSQPNQAAAPAMEPTIACPWCKEGDFDLIGLKAHLEYGDCDAWNEITYQRRQFID